jgi:hypothetical protein
MLSTTASIEIHRMSGKVTISDDRDEIQRWQKDCNKSKRHPSNAFVSIPVPFPRLSPIETLSRCIPRKAIAHQLKACNLPKKAKPRTS